MAESTTLTEDESFFIPDTKSGRKYRSSVGTGMATPHTGSHKKVTAYGARDGPATEAEAGRQCNSLLFIRRKAS